MRKMKRRKSEEDFIGNKGVIPERRPALVLLDFTSNH
jgi:hypothetical protein